MMQAARADLSAMGAANAAIVATRTGHGDGVPGFWRVLNIQVARRVPAAVAMEADSTCKSRMSGNSSMAIPAKKAIRGGMYLPRIKSGYFLNKVETTNQTFSFLSRRRRVK